MRLLRFKNTGFTLIEVMISLVIVSLILTIVTSALRVELDGWERASDKIEELQARSDFRRLVTYQVGQAQLLAGSDGPFAFEGAPDRVEFVTSYSLIDGPTDFRKVVYRFENGQVLYNEAPIDGIRAAGFEDTALASTSNLSFRYLGLSENGQIEWVPVWTGERGLPHAVEIEFDQVRWLVGLDFRS